MNLWPCEVKWPDGRRVVPVRTASTVDGTAVYDVDDNAEPRLMLSTSTPLVRERQVDVYSLTLDDGTSVRVEKLCACNYGAHVLGRFRPTGGAHVEHVRR